MTADYVEVVRTFMEGVGWDDEGQVRSLALLTAGEHLREQRDRGLLELLLRIFADPRTTPSTARPLIQAIARAVGRDWPELPSAARDFDLETEVDPQVLEEAEGLLG